MCLCLPVQFGKTACVFMSRHALVGMFVFEFFFVVCEPVGYFADSLVEKSHSLKVCQSDRFFIVAQFAGELVR